MSEIQRFYENKTIFLTGGTGFLGKLFVEKILRSSNPKKIFLLLREKKGKNPSERLQELFDIPAFSSLTNLKPNYKSLISIIEGDLELVDLGLKQKDKEILESEVNVIIHSGATVRFDENLQKATYINVRSTRDLLILAEKAENLESFVYVSTAFSNCTKQTIDEKFYQPLITSENLLKLVDCLDLETLKQITPTLLQDNPNTYVFTKSIAENQIKDFSKRLPIALVRPSIVVSSYKEPIPGWLDNLFGPTSILLGACFGLIRALNVDKNAPAEIVPVDFVINSIIAAGYKTAKTQESKIYNYVSSKQNLITWENYEILTRKYALKVPSPLVVWHSTLFLIKTRLIFLIYSFFVQTIPAYVVDFAAKLIGKEPMLVKAYKKIDKFCGAISYFSTKSWNFSTDNTISLWNDLNESDQKLFPFNIESMPWEDFFTNYIKGARLYLMKDPLETIPAGRRKLKVLKVAHYTLLIIFIVIFYKIFTFFYNLIH
nr:fatty acyl-CoA reductase wat-like [Onthophagus taurus]